MTEETERSVEAFPSPSPWAAARVEADDRAYAAHLRTRAHNTALNEQDGVRSVLVQWRRGEVVWCTPEAADQWDRRGWR